MSQESIEKNYFDSLIAGHYIDVKYSDQEWKIAKIIERDKRYALVAFDAINAKEEVLLSHPASLSAKLPSRTASYSH